MHGLTVGPESSCFSLNTACQGSCLRIARRLSCFGPTLTCLPLGISMPRVSGRRPDQPPLTGSVDIKNLRRSRILTKLAGLLLSARRMQPRAVTVLMSGVSRLHHGCYRGIRQIAQLRGQGLTAHETGRRGPIRARPRAYQDASGRAYEPVPVTH
jgi:hypothetical protein